MQVIIVLTVLVFCLATVLAQVTINNANNAPDLPGFTANYRRIQKGSIIIPMDPALQVLVPKLGTMSVLPYGLVIRSLYANVTVSWAINTGKNLNGVDFSAVTSRSNWQAVAGAGTAAGDTNWGGWQSTQLTSYSGGPFIIPAQYVPRLLAAWRAWQQNPSAYLTTVDANVYNSVNVHILTADTTIDIRHNIYTHPFIGVSNLDGNAGTQTAMMGCIYQAANRDPNCPIHGGNGAGALFSNGKAGCTAFSPQDHAGLDWGVHYTTYDCSDEVVALTADSCLSTFSEPHWQWDSSSGPTYISSVRNFVYSGANFLAQCASVQSYETFASAGTDGTFMANFGVSPLYPSDGINNQQNTQQSTVTEYPDLPVNQYMGEMSSVMWGAVPDFYNNWANGDATPAGWVAPQGSYPTEAGFNNFKSGAFPLVTNIYNSAGDGTTRGRNVMVASGAKYNQANILGSNVFYLGGHSWVNLANPGTENNRRFFFNAILIPAARPAKCGFSFCIAGSTCDAPDACTTCQCDPSGTGFIYTPVAGCCLNNTMCPGSCTQCIVSSNTCQLIPGCCSSSVTCTTPCTECQNVAANGQGQCLSKGGCCTSTSYCTNTSACINCVDQACVRTPAPDCCDSPSDCTGTCMTCTANTCARVQPLTQCCLTRGDCGNDPCQTCDLSSHLCVAIPGCCNNKSMCGASACVDCNVTTHACYNTPGCCTVDAQCGTCQACNASNKCGPSPDPNCCATNADCGTCRRCAAGVGASSCSVIQECCVSQRDCEICQTCNSTTNQCDDIPNCCRYDSDCSDCQICNSNYTCQVNYDLSCCFTDNDCNLAREQMQNHRNPNDTREIPGCDLVCQIPTNGDPNAKGVCQSVCSSGKNWTGLIVGLAAGVPLGLLFLLAIAGGLIAFLLWKRDAITGALLNKGADPGANANTNPAFDNPVKVGTSGL